MVGFYKDLAWHAPKIFLQSLVRTDTAFDILSKIVLVLFVGYSNPVTEIALRVWTFLTGAKVKLNGVPFWWSLIVLGIIFLHGLFRYVHEEQQRLRSEKRR